MRRPLMNTENKVRYGYVYITTNLINGKKYIGQKASPIFVESYKGSGTLICKALKKYGFENFETKVLEWCFNQEELDKSERRFIEQYDAINSEDFYNLACGGSLGNARKGSRISEEGRKNISKGHLRENLSEKARENMSNGHIGNKNFMYGKCHTEETRARISEVLCDGRMKGEKHPMFGKHHSEETKRKISVSATNPSEETRKKMSEARKRRITTDETRKKLSEAQKKRFVNKENHPMFGKPSNMLGKHHSEEARMKMSKTRKGRPSNMKGKHWNEESKKRCSERQLREKNHMFGKSWMNDGVKNLVVPKELVEEYLIQGYNKGKKKVSR